VWFVQGARRCGNAFYRPAFLPLTLLLCSCPEKHIISPATKKSAKAKSAKDPAAGGDPLVLTGNIGHFGVGAQHSVRRVSEGSSRIANAGCARRAAKRPVVCKLTCRCRVLLSTSSSPPLSSLRPASSPPIPPLFYPPPFSSPVLFLHLARCLCSGALLRPGAAFMSLLAGCCRCGT
jgi:hypothetical protein